jgi:hypothetical protein
MQYKLTMLTKESSQHGRLPSPLPHDQFRAPKRSSSLVLLRRKGRTKRASTLGSRMRYPKGRDVPYLEIVEREAFVLGEAAFHREYSQSDGGCILPRLDRF